MEGYEKNDGMEMNDRDEIYSKPVRAGKRTYFFDVKATRNNDYYLTITETRRNSKKMVLKITKSTRSFYTKKTLINLQRGLTTLSLISKQLLTEKQWQFTKKLKQTNLTTLILTIYPNNKKALHREELFCYYIYP